MLLERRQTLKLDRILSCRMIRCVCCFPFWSQFVTVSCMAFLRNFPQNILSIENIILVILIARDMGL